MLPGGCISITSARPATAASGSELESPLPKRLHVLSGSEGGAAALICFEDHAADILRLDAQVGERSLKELERCVRHGETVRKGRLYKTPVQVDDPFLQRRYAACLLRAERAPMKRMFERHDHVLAAASRLDPVGAAELDRALDGLRSGGQQEHALERRGQKGGEALHESRASRARGTDA